MNDSLNLNQTAAAHGTLTEHRNTAPTETCTGTRLLRALDGDTHPDDHVLHRRDHRPEPPSLGAPHQQRRPDDLQQQFAGTALAFDIENLQISYDLVDGVNNPSEVKFTAADLGGTGRCSPNACSPNQIRKINILLTGRSRTTLRQTRQYLRNSLTTQVSLRSMSFIDRYR